MGQATLGVSLLGPGVAEIQIEHVYRMRSKPFKQCLGVADDKAQVICGAFFFLCYGFFHGVGYDVGYTLHRVKADIGMLFCHSTSKAALAAAYFQMQGALLAKMKDRGQNRLLRFFAKQGTARIQAAVQVLLFSHSHKQIYAFHTGKSA